MTKKAPLAIDSFSGEQPKATSSTQAGLEKPLVHGTTEVIEAIEDRATFRSQDRARPADTHEQEKQALRVGISGLFFIGFIIYEALT